MHLHNNIYFKALFGLVLICTVVQLSVQFPTDGNPLEDLIQVLKIKNETIATTVEPKIGASNVTVSESKTTAKKRTCACDDGTGSNPLCANNGVTYKSTCRFECAKARVTRLRIVRMGQCSQTTGTGAYWNKQG